MLKKGSDSDKLNLALIGRNGELIMEEDEELFTLSQDRNLRDLNDANNEINFKTNLSHSQTHINECCRDGDLQLFCFLWSEC